MQMGKAVYLTQDKMYDWDLDKNIGLSNVIEEVFGDAGVIDGVQCRHGKLISLTPLGLAVLTNDRFHRLKDGERVTTTPWTVFLARLFNDGFDVELVAYDGQRCFMVRWRYEQPSELDDGPVLSLGEELTKLDQADLYLLQAATKTLADGFTA
jgi:hypothetical protein